MKKCYALKEMRYPDKETSFEEARIKLRNPIKLIPFFGTIRRGISNYDYDFRDFSE